MPILGDIPWNPQKVRDSIQVITSDSGCNFLTDSSQVQKKRYLGYVF